MFYKHVEIHHRGWYRLSAGFCKRLHLDSWFIELSSRHHLIRTLQTEQSVHLNVIRDDFRWYFDDSAVVTRRSREDSSMNLDVNVCKNQRWVCNIRGEEFQLVGRTIFIKSKMLLFLYILIISIRIFKILIFITKS